MKKKSEPQDVVDSIEEREVLWGSLILRQDCGNCPRGESSSRLIIACLRCFEKYPAAVVSKGGPYGF